MSIRSLARRARALAKRRPPEPPTPTAGEDEAARRERVRQASRHMTSQEKRQRVAQLLAKAAGRASATAQGDFAPDVALRLKAILADVRRRLGGTP